VRLIGRQHLPADWDGARAISISSSSEIVGTVRSFQHSTSCPPENLNDPESLRPSPIHCQLVVCHLVCGCSQGGVKIPTGGMRHRLRARERLPLGRV